MIIERSSVTTVLLVGLLIGCGSQHRCFGQRVMGLLKELEKKSFLRGKRKEKRKKPELNHQKHRGK